jgi:hypothetical protein
MYEFIQLITVATTAAIEAWANSPLLPDLHHQRHILQTKAAQQNIELNFKNNNAHNNIFM